MKCIDLELFKEVKKCDNQNLCRGRTGAGIRQPKFRAPLQFQTWKSVAPFSQRSTTTRSHDDGSRRSTVRRRGDAMACCAIDGSNRLGLCWTISLQREEPSKGEPKAAQGSEMVDRECDSSHSQTTSVSSTLLAGQSCRDTTTPKSRYASSNHWWYPRHQFGTVAVSHINPTVSGSSATADPSAGRVVEVQCHVGVCASTTTATIERGEQPHHVPSGEGRSGGFGSFLVRQSAGGLGPRRCSGAQPHVFEERKQTLSNSGRIVAIHSVANVAAPQ